MAELPEILSAAKDFKVCAEYLNSLRALKKELKAKLAKENSDSDELRYALELLALCRKIDEAEGAKAKLLGVPKATPGA